MAETLSYQAIRSANQAREADEQRTESRKKNLLILVLHYLSEEGYIESSQTLGRETNIDLNRYEVCDNVDLDTVLMEYESYYYIKFARYPKITKKLTQSATEDRKFQRSTKMRRSHRRTNSTLESSRSNSLTRQGSTTLQSPRLPLVFEDSKSSTPSLPRLQEPRRPSSPQPAQTNGTMRARPGSGVRKQAPPGEKTQKKPVSSNGVVSQDSIEDNQLSLQGLVVQGNPNSEQPNGHDNIPVPPPGMQRRKAGQIIDIRSMINEATRLNVEEGSGGVNPSEKLLKPLGGYVGYNQEWRELAQVISRDIYSENPDVRWDDIIGLDDAKRLVKEAVVYPIRYPQLFTGILSPWKGLLLYGPPGTGKTLLAKAVATECGTTFFNISASSIVSKWRGDSEKLVRVLFELARFHAPSTIFLDELESLMSQRGSSGGGTGDHEGSRRMKTELLVQMDGINKDGSLVFVLTATNLPWEHEGSRRMKTELLVQMDGLAKTDDLVFLLAASNLPWELDHAMLRRLEKRILVDLPTYEARRAMFHHHLPPVVTSNRQNGLELTADIDYEQVAKKTEGYSGSDIKLVCKEAAMRPVRKIFYALENHTEGKDLHLHLDTIQTQDVQVALQHTKPSARTLVEKYSAWQKEYESL